MDRIGNATTLGVGEDTNSGLGHRSTSESRLPQAYDFTQGEAVRGTFQLDGAVDAQRLLPRYLVKGSGARRVTTSMAPPRVGIGKSV